MNIPSLCHQYLVHSFLYYILDTSIVPDFEFDMICRTLAANYDKIPPEYKNLIDLDSLHASTGYSLTAADYPDKVLQAVNFLYKSGQLSL